MLALTLIWVGILGARFELGGGGKITSPPCLKFVRIMLETSNSVRKFTPICSFRKYTFQCLGPLIFADVSIFCKKLAFFVQISTVTQSNSVRAVLEIFLVLFSVFVRQKLTVTENITFAHSVSRIRPPDCSKLAKYPKNDNDVTVFRHDVNVKLF